MLDARPQAPLPTVAVVAADRRVRESVASLLTASGDVRLVGAAGDAAAAVRLVAGSGPQVVIVDRELANGGGNLVTLLRVEAPNARILVIEWDGPLAAFTGAGADAVLDLADQPSMLLEAVLRLPARPRTRGRRRATTGPTAVVSSD